MAASCLCVVTCLVTFWACACLHFTHFFLASIIITKRVIHCSCIFALQSFLHNNFSDVSLFVVLLPLFILLTLLDQVNSEGCVGIVDYLKGGDQRVGREYIRYCMYLWCPPVSTILVPVWPFYTLSLLKSKNKRIRWYFA